MVSCFYQKFTPDFQAFLHLLSPSLPVLIHFCLCTGARTLSENPDSVEPVRLSPRPTEPLAKLFCGQNLEACLWSQKGAHIKTTFSFAADWCFEIDEFERPVSNSSSLRPRSQANLALRASKRCAVCFQVTAGCMARLWTSSSNRVTGTLLWIITPSVRSSWATAHDQCALFSPADDFDIVTFTLAIDWDDCLGSLAAFK